LQIQPCENATLYLVPYRNMRQVIEFSNFRC